MIKLGIDIGATGIKGALVNIKTGEYKSDRIRYLTPKNATPKQTLKIIQQIVKDLNWDGDIGIGLPLLIRKNICIWSSNLNDKWKGLDLASFFTNKLNQKICVANDADVAGLAESRFGTNDQISKNGFVLFLTLGTGIGSALIIKGKLLPNTEFGHMPYKNSKLEDYIANSVRVHDEMSWETYGKKLNRAIHKLHFVLSPDRIILGGGISKKFDKYAPFLDKELNIVPATLQNKAGIIGAALLCV